MIRKLRTLFAGFLLGLLSVGFLWSALRPASAPPREPDPPALIERIREIARLETLDVTVHKKVTYAPPVPRAESFVGEVLTWATQSARPKEGRAIVFADVHLGLDLSRIDETMLQVSGDRVEVTLPPVVGRVEIKPGETEIVRSTLDANGVAQMLDEGKFAIERDVMNDEGLKDRARGSAKRALRAFLETAGFREVVFSDEIQGPAA